MSITSLILFLLGAFYAAGLIFRFPFFYESNPKTRFIIQKIGMGPYKILLGAIAAACIIAAIVLR